MRLPNSVASSNTPSTSANQQHPSSFLSQSSSFHSFYYQDFLNQHRLAKVVEEWVDRLAVEVAAVSRAAGRIVHPEEVVVVVIQGGGRMVHPAEVVGALQGGTAEEVRVDIILGPILFFRRELVAGKSALFVIRLFLFVSCPLYSTPCFSLSIYNLYSLLKAHSTPPTLVHPE